MFASYLTAVFYCIRHTFCLMQGVLQMEKKLGGCLMDKPKTMLFQDGGASLCLSMEDIGPGWKSKPQADYQVCVYMCACSTDNKIVM